MPRFRIDHMLEFNWKFLTPLALVMLMVTALMDKALAGVSPILYALGMLAANLVVGWIVLVLVRRYAHLERVRVGEPRPVASSDLATLPGKSSQPPAMPTTP